MSTPGPEGSRRDRINLLTIETLVLSELTQLDRIVSLEREVRAYRELAHAALAALHEQHTQQAKLRERMRGVLDEVRALRRASQQAAA